MPRQGAAIGSGDRPRAIGHRAGQPARPQNFKKEVCSSVLGRRRDFGGETALGRGSPRRWATGIATPGRRHPDPAGRPDRWPWARSQVCTSVSAQERPTRDSKGCSPKAPAHRFRRQLRVGESGRDATPRRFPLRSEVGRRIDVDRVTAVEGGPNPAVGLDHVHGHVAGRPVGARGLPAPAVVVDACQASLWNPSAIVLIPVSHLGDMRLTVPIPGQRSAW